MLKRLQIDNYKCFVNFELQLDRNLHVFLGGNGSGKSTIGEVLRMLRGFVVSALDCDRLFGGTRCRWVNAAVQEFAVELQIDGHTHRYELHLEYNSDSVCSVQQERLSVNGRDVVHVQNRTIRMDGGEPIKGISLDPRRSAFSVLSREGKEEWMPFFRWLADFRHIRIAPGTLGSVTTSESYSLVDSASNFPDWFRYHSLENFGLVSETAERLRLVMPGFERLSIRGREDGRRVLTATFRRKGVEREFELHELSEGQQSLIVLHSLVGFLLAKPLFVIFDEPQNFVSLSEIYPWVLALRDRLGETGAQAAIISHHPQILDALAVSHGVLFRMTDFGWVKAGKPDWPADSPLLPSEWLTSRDANG